MANTTSSVYGNRLPHGGRGVNTEVEAGCTWIMHRERRDAESQARRDREAAQTQHATETAAVTQRLADTLATVEELEALLSDAEGRFAEAVENEQLWKQKADELLLLEDRLRDEHTADRRDISRQVHAARTTETEAVRSREEALATVRVEEAKNRGLAEMLDRERHDRKAIEQLLADARAQLARTEAERNQVRATADTVVEAEGRIRSEYETLAAAMTSAREHIAALEASLESECTACARFAGLGEQLQLLVDRIPTGEAEMPVRKRAP